METFCETVQFYLRHLEDSVYPVMTEEQFAIKLFPMYRYFVTVWLRSHNPEVRSLLRGPAFPRIMAPQPVGLGEPRDRWVYPHSQNPREMVTCDRTEWALAPRRRVWETGRGLGASEWGRAVGAPCVLYLRELFPSQLYAVGLVCK